MAGDGGDRNSQMAEVQPVAPDLASNGSGACSPAVDERAEACPSQRASTFGAVSMNKLLLSGIALAVTVLLASCSTVTRGTTNQIQVVSNPSEAQVKTSIGNACTTPCSFEVSRKSEFIATISKDGYKSQDVPVKTKVAGAGAAGFAGNVLVGGIVGMGVDAATGATLEHYPNPINVTLEPVTPAIVPRPSRHGRTAHKRRSPEA